LASVDGGLQFQGIVERAVGMIADGDVVGLGTGRAATAFIHALGDRVRGGLRVRGVPTSVASAQLAEQLGIPLVSLDEVPQIDIDIDGADEVDPACNLIKGLGGALVREKIVASAARQFVVVVGAEKLVPTLGAHGVLPVEVVPFGLSVCSRHLKDLGCEPVPRMTANQLFRSDNGNYILDCRISPIERPADLERAILAVPGVVASGLFLDMADVVLVQNGDAVDVREGRRGSVREGRSLSAAATRPAVPDRRPIAPAGSGERDTVTRDADFLFNRDELERFMRVLHRLWSDTHAVVENGPQVIELVGGYILLIDPADISSGFEATIRFAPPDTDDHDAVIAQRQIDGGKADLFQFVMNALCDDTANLKERLACLRP
jgi:ribose 5-phosphate isomerase A